MHDSMGIERIHRPNPSHAHARTHRHTCTLMISQWPGARAKKVVAMAVVGLTCDEGSAGDGTTAGVGVTVEETSAVGAVMFAVKRAHKFPICLIGAQIGAR